MAPVGKRPAAPPAQVLLDRIRWLLLDRRGFWPFAGLLFLGELVLGLLIIRFVSCELVLPSGAFGQQADSEGLPVFQTPRSTTGPTWSRWKVS